MIKLKYLAGYCEVFSVFEESPGSFCDSDTVFAFSSVFELSGFDMNLASESRTITNLIQKLIKSGNLKENC